VQAAGRHKASGTPVDRDESRGDARFSVRLSSSIRGGAFAIEGPTHTGERWRLEWQRRGLGAILGTKTTAPAPQCREHHTIQRYRGKMDRHPHHPTGHTLHEPLRAIMRCGAIEPCGAAIVREREWVSAASLLEKTTSSHGQGPMQSLQSLVSPSQARHIPGPC
jgi:hypothetical protein